MGVWAISIPVRNSMQMAKFNHLILNILCLFIAWEKIIVNN